MENSGAIKASLQGRYASALFDLASEAGTVSTVESDLEGLGQALRESAEMADLIRNPQLSRKAAGQAIDAVAGVLGVSPLTRNFLGVLAANRRLASLPGIVTAFAAIAAAQRGEVSAEVASAHPLSEAQVEELRHKLEAREGRKIKLSTRIDPELLGGLVVTIGSKRIDSSIRTRLNSLAQAMQG
ncbi:F0F1 ATP synthase subunit delta [Novosphingobium sp. 9]|uniref:F0F1 ATP synthase subunit delta n=1 Tax=Novosphingobium sp. 9 TaxID=2025349 RepID=UPI0021B541B8|nr:F0F1 ATP synthase subunit delta [Novosphingobium sp. 9]